MADMIRIGGLLVSRERQRQGYAPVKISFKRPITDESLRSLAAFAYGIERGELETMQKLGIEAKEG